ncbi:TetR/AcrR family transcriptional regulator [Mesorhizobium sp. M1A.F.Ca.IN.022.07.1.1]|uniref:TetR/AcrR family transcriptional regulator n=1 Tax=Mesorhizobium sp. M1A.F.Ca.IN.022.07.1.1 TaxID=2496767 RepID=UPI000FCBA802|nr:TetR/AcrR family transcriptional regulator [Mesorhizobium sp. M1A.F.Ca.IN.022.07.1.1]RUV80574.1 TetR/AcrR family transcriptional regulator [Mesorhizobium sp. M1A.F.Ca.IN.022.07.1.1]TIS52708.1 MAG: TetR family transcriptional regulator [Mesorhizobium sp.]
MKIERSDDIGTIDRRVARTRAMLQDALIALIPEGRYAALTVEDICEKANIGRSTFYTHYAGKDELRTATLEAHLRSLTQKRLSASTERGKRLFEFSLQMFEHAQAFRSLHHALLSSSGDTIHDQLRDRIRRAVRSELAGSEPADMPLDFAVQFVSGAFLAVLAWWIAERADLSASQIDELFQRMAAEGFGFPCV